MINKQTKSINFTLYISDVDRWWNNGNEFKPNLEEFDQIQWIKHREGNLTIDLKNYWSASIFVSKPFFKKIFKIEFDQELAYLKRNTTYYYYVEKINYWTGNSFDSGEHIAQVQLSLDVWCTYVLKDVSLEAWSNRFNRSWKYPMDQIRGFIKNDNLLLDSQRSRSEKINFLPQQLLSVIKKNDHYNNQQDVIFNQKFRYKNLIKYYVFKEKKESGYRRGDNNIILIPVLLETNSYDHKPNLKDCTREFLPFYIDDLGFNAPARLYLLNDDRNLLNMVDKRLDYRCGLGDFVGCFIGPNFFRIEPMLNYEARIGSMGQINIAQIIPINWYSAEREVIGFWCLRISNDWPFIKTYPNSEVDKIVKAVASGLYPLGDEKAWMTTTEADLIFTDKFVYTNKLNTFAEPTELPIYNDTYFEWLAKTKPNRDQAINVANQQLGFGLFNNLFNGFYGNISKAAAGFVSLNPQAVSSGVHGVISEGVVGLAKTAIQYQNTMRQIEVEKETQRLNTSTSITSSDATFLNRYNQLTQTIDLNNNVIDEPLVITTDINERAYEFFSGTEKINIINMYNFAGFETGWYNLGININKVKQGYLKWPSSLVNSNVLNQFNNDEKAAIIKLLSAGVRVGYKREVENDFN